MFFDVCIENKGSVRLGAKRQRRPAYQDDAEELAYSVDLLLRPVLPGATPNSQVRWFATESDRSPQPADIEIDLVAEYEIGGETDFWLEPGETYHLGAAVVLRPMSYLAMVTFVGDRNDKEFWRRVFLVDVPKMVAEMHGSPLQPADNG